MSTNACWNPDCDKCLSTEEPCPRPRRERTVLDEARALVHGDRNDAYGTPASDFGRAAVMLTGLLGDKLKAGAAIEPADVGKIQIIIKLSRAMHRYKRDTYVDIAGYAEAIDWCEEERLRNPADPFAGRQPGNE